MGEEEKLPYMVGSYEVQQHVGGGSYGTVFLCKNKTDKKDKKYIMKKINLTKNNEKTIKASQQEAELLRKLKHPNIVSYFDSFTDNGFLYIVMTFCEGGDLYHKIKEQRETNPGQYFEEHFLMTWFIQISMAIQYLHAQNILHRDLKTQNIFLTKAQIIKVGDLGIARVLEDAGDVATTIVGTPYYMSPELFTNQPYNFKSDVWALGCVLFEMSTLRHAFSAHDLNSLASKICRGKIPPLPQIYSRDLTDLVKSLLAQQADKRPTVRDILRLPFIRGHIMKYLEARQNDTPVVAVASGHKDQKQDNSQLDEDKQLVNKLREETGEALPAAAQPRPVASNKNPPAIKSAVTPAAQAVLNNDKPYNEAARAKRRQRIEEQKRLGSGGPSGRLNSGGPSQRARPTSNRPPSNNNSPKPEASTANADKQQRAVAKLCGELQKTLTLADDTQEEQTARKGVADVMRQNPQFTIAVGENTLASRTRLAQRIEQLHRDCLRGLGLKRFHEAWQLLSNELAANSDQVETKMRAVLGNEDYDNFAAKIWNLKFCEDVQANNMTND